MTCTNSACDASARDTARLVDGHAWFVPCSEGLGSGCPACSEPDTGLIAGL